jgi:hypothetical protein
LVRSIEFVIGDLEAVGPLEGTTLNLSDLPTSADGLTEGDVFVSDGVLNIVAPTTDLTPISQTLTLTGSAPSVVEA